MQMIEVRCRCGTKLFKYQKVGKGKLIKCYLSRIIEDNIGLTPKVSVGDLILCPRCEERIGTIYGIRGVMAIKLNHGQIMPFRLD